jgi:hypothetical protein
VGRVSEYKTLVLSIQWIPLDIERRGLSCVALRRGDLVHILELRRLADHGTDAPAPQELVKVECELVSRDGVSFLPERGLYPALAPPAAQRLEGVEDGSR